MSIARKLRNFQLKEKLWFKGTQTFDRSFFNIVTNLWTTNALISYIYSISEVCSKLMAITFKPTLFFFGDPQKFWTSPENFIVGFQVFICEKRGVAWFLWEGVVVECPSTKCLSRVAPLFWCVSAQV